MSYYKRNKNVPLTFLVKDYETFSTDTQKGKVSQFAAIRTDENFNIVKNSKTQKEETYNIFCELPEFNDSLPSPMACLITKMTPQTIEEYAKDKNKLNNLSGEEKGVYNEYWFMNKISYELTKNANTCVLGYNNFSFDDEVTRNLLYRNFRDPYEREWKNNNSRFDLYPLVMATSVLKPDLLNFPPKKDPDTNEILINPRNNQPYPSLRLEELSEANGIKHENAHDALNDVHATIGVAKIIKDKDPEFFNKMFKLRNKKEVISWLNERENKPFLYMSSYFGKENDFLGVMLKIADHPENKNAIIAYNIRKNPELLIKENAEKIKEILYSKKEKLEEDNIERIGLQVIKINQAPMLADLIEVKTRAQELGLCGNELRENRKLVLDNINEIKQKVLKIFEEDPEQAEKNKLINDTDKMIYIGGFFSNEDKNEFIDINKEIKAKNLSNYKLPIRNNRDSRIEEMFFRLKGRNFKESLGIIELENWKEHCISELRKEVNKDSDYNFVKYYEEINELKKEKKYQNEESMKILNNLESYGKKLAEKLGLKLENELNTKKETKVERKNKY